MTITQLRFIEEPLDLKHCEHVVATLAKIGRTAVLIRKGPVMSYIPVLDGLTPTTNELMRASKKGLDGYQSRTELRILTTEEITVPFLENRGLGMPHVAAMIVDYIAREYDPTWPIVVWEHWRCEVEDVVTMILPDDAGNQIKVEGPGMLFKFYIAGRKGKPVQG